MTTTLSTHGGATQGAVVRPTQGAVVGAAVPRETAGDRLTDVVLLAVALAAGLGAARLTRAPGQPARLRREAGGSRRPRGSSAGA